MNSVTLVLPIPSENVISELLRQLTKRVCEVTNSGGGFGLGGEFGYGEDFENDVFMLHRYCWCDSEECPWCSGDEPNFRHKPTGARISWYKYIGRGMEADKADWYIIFSECFESLGSTLEH